MIVRAVSHFHFGLNYKIMGQLGVTSCLDLSCLGSVNFFYWAGPSGSLERVCKTIIKRWVEITRTHLVLKKLNLEEFQDTYARSSLT